MIVFQLYCPACGLPLTAAGGDDAWKMPSNFAKMSAEQQVEALKPGIGHLHFKGLVMQLNCGNSHGPFDFESDSLMWVGDLAKGGESEVSKDQRDSTIDRAEAAKGA